MDARAEQAIKVSIHAPTRGATGLNVRRQSYLAFQSTRPRGARQKLLNRPSTQLRFNPRAHAGRDLLDDDGVSAVMVSIHAPTRGATIIARSSSPILWFQSTRPRGARLRLKLGWQCRYCFNPRAHAGRDSARAITDTADSVSIHAPTRGATPT